MLDIKIPKEIKKYESKFIGDLSFRKAAITGLGAGIILFLVWTFKGVVPYPLLLLMAMLIAVPFAMVGFFEIYGLPFEKFFKIVIKTNIKTPKIRKYEIENQHETNLRNINTDDDVENNSNTKKKKKKKKKKYKKSKEAIK